MMTKITILQRKRKKRKNNFAKIRGEKKKQGMQFSKTNNMFGTVQKLGRCVTLVDIGRSRTRRSCKLSSVFSILVANIGFDTADNEPPQSFYEMGYRSPSPTGLDLPDNYRPGRAFQTMSVGLVVDCGNPQQLLLDDGRGHPVVAESGRRHTLKVACAKRPHGRLRRLSAELENVGEASDFLERRAVPAAFRKNPENFWLNLVKIQQNSGKICEILGKKQQKFSNF